MNPTELIILIVLAALVVLALSLGKKRGDDSRSARMMKKYETMTREVFDSIPEGEYTEAMVCHVLAQTTTSRHPDPLACLADMSHGYTVAYCVWLICKELATADFATLMQSRSRDALELAADGMDAVGAPESAAALRTLQTAYAADIAEETYDTAAAYKAAEEAFHTAVVKEQPLGLCEGYIVDHADELIDDPQAAEVSDELPPQEP